MRRWKTAAMAAAVIFAIGLTARADEDADRRRAREDDFVAQRDREAAEREAAEREGQRDREAAERARPRDRDAGQRERRRDEGSARDDGRRGPPERPRGPMRREEMMERMMGGGMQPGMGGMRGMMGGGMMGGGMMGGGPGMQNMEPDLDRLREADPEMFELEQNDRRLDHESHQLAEQFHRTPEGPAREELRGKLHEVVAQHFKVRQAKRELEVKRLEAQLERLRGALEKRSKDADAIIERRASQLLGEEDFGF